MSLLLLARHGNTFGPGDKIVWVGAKEDLPLVKSGEAQAAALGEVLRARGIAPARLVSGPLKRTRRAADIVKAITMSDADIAIDTRLTEIDYGRWGGKTDDEIAEIFGANAIPDWREHHKRPDDAGWSPGDDELKSNALGVLADMATGAFPGLVITSNGILRYFHAAIGFDGDAKVKTGHVCAARKTADGWQPLFWNAHPETLPELT